jgi:hypothetical protein
MINIFLNLFIFQKWKFFPDKSDQVVLGTNVLIIINLKKGRGFFMNNSLKSELRESNDLYNWRLDLDELFISHKGGLYEHFNDSILHFYESFIPQRNFLFFPYKF